MAHSIEITPDNTNTPATIPLSQIRWATAGTGKRAVVTLVDGTTIEAKETYESVSKQMIENSMPFLSVENVS